MNKWACRGRSSRSRGKWDHLKDKYKVAAGLNDNVETKLYLFCPCKLMNHLMKIADMIDFHCLPLANIQGQERGSAGFPALLLGPGLSMEANLFYNSN